MAHQERIHQKEKNQVERGKASDKSVSNQKASIVVAQIDLGSSVKDLRQNFDASSRSSQTIRESQLLANKGPYQWGPLSEIYESQLQFSKCATNLEVKVAIASLYDVSPFKRGELKLIEPPPHSQSNRRGGYIDDVTPRIELSRRRQEPLIQSVQSEDILETQEGLTQNQDRNDYASQIQIGQSVKSELESVGRVLISQLSLQPPNNNYNSTSVNQRDSIEMQDVSLNKSHMTMEDNNKASKKKGQCKSEGGDAVSGDIMLLMNEGGQKVYVSDSLQSEKKESERKESVDQQSPDPIDPNQERIFALLADSGIHNHNIETSFDSMTSIGNTNYLVTSSEDQGLSNRDHPVQNEFDPIIEQELNKISTNLNTFTVEHFNQLRDHIQTIGFHKAATKAKKDFHLVTLESSNTIMSSMNKDEDDIMATIGAGPVKEVDKLWKIK